MYYPIPIDYDLYKQLNKDRSLSYFFRSDRVGKCIQLIDDCYHKHNGILDSSDWEKYYFERMPIEPFGEATTYILKNYDVTISEAKKYVFYRVIGQTWNGLREEMNIIEELTEEFPNIHFKKAPYEIDEKYFTDYEAYMNGNLLFGIQIKPLSYDKMMHPYQLKAKANHEFQREQYKEEFKVPHILIFYQNHFLHNKEYVINQINTISALKIKVNYESNL